MFILPYKMTSGGNSLTVAVLLIIMMSDLTLSCPSTMYQTESRCCPMCAAGSRVQADCTEQVTTSCVPCGDGTYMDKLNGLRKCIQCTQCHQGSSLKEKEACTVRSDTVCEPLEGFYCLDHAGLSCVAAHKHRHCQPGQYIIQTGTATTDTRCSDCRNGTFSNGTLKICRLHKLCESLNLRLITPGNATTDAQCGEYVNVVAPWVIIGCLLLFLLIVILIILLYFRKKIPCLKRDKKTSVRLTNIKKKNKETEALNKQSSAPV